MALTTAHRASFLSDGFEDSGDQFSIGGALAVKRVAAHRLSPEAALEMKLTLMITRRSASDDERRSDVRMTSKLMHARCHPMNTT
jgi:hypothetical protein